MLGIHWSFWNRGNCLGEMDIGFLASIKNQGLVDKKLNAGLIFYRHEIWYFQSSHGALRGRNGVSRIYTHLFSLLKKVAIYIFFGGC